MTHHMHAPANNSGAALAFLAGAAAGIAAGLLFAPRGGEETRTQLKGKMQRARQKAMATLENQKHAIADTAKAQADKATDAVHRATDTIDDTVDEVQDRVRKPGRNATREL